MVVTDLQWFNEDYWYGLDQEELTEGVDTPELFGYEIDAAYVRTEELIIWWWKDPRILPDYMLPLLRNMSLELVEQHAPQICEKHKKSKKKKH